MADGCSHFERGSAACGDSSILVAGGGPKFLRNGAENKKNFSPWLYIRIALLVSPLQNENKTKIKYAPVSSIVIKLKIVLLIKFLCSLT